MAQWRGGPVFWFGACGSSAFFEGSEVWRGGMNANCWSVWLVGLPSWVADDVSLGARLVAKYVYDRPPWDNQMDLSRNRESEDQPLDHTQKSQLQWGWGTMEWGSAFWNISRSKCLFSKVTPPASNTYPRNIKQDQSEAVVISRMLHGSMFCSPPSSRDVRNWRVLLPFCFLQARWWWKPCCFCQTPSWKALHLELRPVRNQL